jgi:hypothetical protein
MPKIVGKIFGIYTILLELKSHKPIEIYNFNGLVAFCLA